MPQSKDNHRHGYDKIFYLSELVMSRTTNSCPDRLVNQYHCNNTKLADAVSTQIRINRSISYQVIYEATSLLQYHK